jgi:hypothetical protein
MPSPDCFSLPLSQWGGPAAADTDMEDAAGGKHQDGVSPAAVTGTHTEAFTAAARSQQQQQQQQQQGASDLASAPESHMDVEEQGQQQQQDGSAAAAAAGSPKGSVAGDAASPQQQQKQQGASAPAAAVGTHTDSAAGAAGSPQQQQQQQQQQDASAPAAAAGSLTESVTSAAASPQQQQQQQQQQRDGLAAAAAAGTHREALQSAGAASMTAAQAAPRRSERLASSKQQQQESAVQVKSEATAAGVVLCPQVDAEESANILAFSKRQQEGPSAKGREAKRHRPDEPPAHSGHSSGLDAELSAGGIVGDTAGGAEQVRATGDVVLCRLCYLMCVVRSTSVAEMLMITTHVGSCARCDRLLNSGMCA